MSATRTEKDTFGDIEVPAERLWGAQTQRSLQHFQISGERMPRELIARAGAGQARLRRASTRDSACSTARQGRTRIMRAADEVLAGKHDDEFPLVGLADRLRHADQHEHERGAGQPRLASCSAAQRGEARLVHPNDDVNRGQSSNDVFPTAMHVAAGAGASRSGCCRRCARCAPRSTQKRADFADIVKIGRTHLQDATPLTLGQEFSGYVAQLDHAQRGASTRRCRTCASWRSAAPRSAPASTRIRSSARASRRNWREHWACRSSAPPTSSRRWPRTTRWCSRTAR